MMKKPCVADIILDVERTVSHQIAHALNNSLGAIGVLADMISEEVEDVDVQKRLSKVTLAAEMARSQVTALRYTVPRPDQTDRVVPFAFVRETIMLMLGDLGGRLDVEVDPSAAVATLKGERAAMIYAMTTLASHVLGATSSRVSMSAILCEGSPLGDDDAPLMGEGVSGPALRVDIVTLDNVDVGNVRVDDVFWDRMMVACGAAVYERPQGFRLFWPCAV